LEALSDCLNRHFSERFGEPSLEQQNTHSAEENLQPFDRHMLNELVEVMGKPAVLANFQLFANVMPEYLANLRQYLQAWQQSGDTYQRKFTADEAHKIKGALASVGLSQLQQIAQLAQTDNGESWENGIENWVNQLEAGWRNDLNLATQWINR